METLIGVLCTLLSTLVGIYFTRYYYLKSNPEKKSVGALTQAFRKHRTSSSDTEPSPAKESVPLKWIQALIEAYERHEIYLVELQICLRTFREAADWLGDPVGDASRAADAIAQRLTPPWFEEQRQVLGERLKAARLAIQDRLKGKVC